MRHTWAYMRRIRPYMGIYDAHTGIYEATILRIGMIPLRPTSRSMMSSRGRLLPSRPLPLQRQNLHLLQPVSFPKKQLLLRISLPLSLSSHRSLCDADSPPRSTTVPFAFVSAAEARWDFDDKFKGTPAEW